MQIPHISLIKRISADVLLETYGEDECVVHSSSKKEDEVLEATGKHFPGKELTIQETEENDSFKSWKLKID